MAAPSVKENAIGGVGTGTTVSVSTSAWTKVPAGTDLANRSGILVNNPSSNTSVMVGVLSASATAPTEATTVRPLEFSPNKDFTFVPASGSVYLYLLSLNGSAENVHVQEIVQ